MLLAATTTATERRCSPEQMSKRGQERLRGTRFEAHGNVGLPFDTVTPFTVARELAQIEAHGKVDCRDLQAERVNPWRSRKPLGVVRRLVGSNPTPSAPTILATQP